MIYSKFYGEKIKIFSKDLNLQNGGNHNNWIIDLLLLWGHLHGYNCGNNLQCYCMVFLLFP